MGSQGVQTLTPEEMERYDRQIRIFGVEGQLRLKRAKVLIVGIGGLGSPAAIYLAAAGVGEIILVDPERVELSNLNRQILHWTRDVGRLKVESAAEKLRELNPNVRLRIIAERADEELLDKLVPEVDIVIDGLDDWNSRLQLNKVCVKHGKPLIHAAIHGMYGQLLVVVPGKTPCLNCIIIREPPETRPFPVLGVTPGILSMLQVTETLKLLTGYGKPSLGKLIIYDGYTLKLEEIPVSRNPHCPTCSIIRQGGQHSEYAVKSQQF
ncbi:MAG: HesA/MoeB/ThiF family protein [Thermoprotei archaeon]|nr:HesA/MoeB/ThiF family protein [Thermoprotei archaeon]